MRQTVSLRSFTDRRGYGDECAVCPFCGKINDAAHPETRCHHLVRWNTREHDPQLASATFTDSPRQEQQEREQQKGNDNDKANHDTQPSH